METMSSRASSTIPEPGRCLAHAKDLARHSKSHLSALQGSLFEVEDGCADINAVSKFLNVLASLARGTSKPPRYAVTMMDASEGYYHISILGFRADDDCQFTGDEGLGALLEVIGRALFVFEHGNPKHRGDAEKCLRASLLQFYLGRSRRVIASLEACLSKQKGVFIGIVDKITGLADSPEEKIDYSIGDRVIAFWETVAYVDSQKIEVSTYENIVNIATDIMRQISLRERIERLIPDSNLAHNILAWIGAIAMPGIAFERTLHFSREIKISGIVIRELSPFTVRTLPGQATSAAAAAATTTAAATTAATTTAATTTAATRALPSMVAPEMSAGRNSQQMSKLRQAFPRISRHTLEYLPENLRNKGYAHIDPIQRSVLDLLNALLSAEPKSPCPQNPAYLDFGFAGCRPNEKSNLVKAYLELILNYDDKPKMFDIFCQSARSNTLLELLEESGADMECLKGASTYFRTPPHRRPTVFLLMQFLETPETEPPPYFKRDYGFIICHRRDEVESLKKIYAVIMTKCGPMELHEACIQPRLLEFAQSKKVPVAENYKRFLTNDYHPDLGFQTPGGPGRRYERPLFRRRL